MILRCRTRLLLCALLTFQLALGMSWASMRPATAATVWQLGEAGAEPCPEHEMGSQGADTEQTQAGTRSAAQQGRHSLPDHSCCHTVGCQCYINYPPAVSAPRLSQPLAFFTYLPSVSSAPPAMAPPDERLRPPIA